MLAGAEVETGDKLALGLGRLGRRPLPPSLTLLAKIFQLERFWNHSPELWCVLASGVAREAAPPPPGAGLQAHSHQADGSRLRGAAARCDLEAAGRGGVAEAKLRCRTTCLAQSPARGIVAAAAAADTQATAVTPAIGGGDCHHHQQW